MVLVLIFCSYPTTVILSEVETRGALRFIETSEGLPQGKDLAKQLSLAFLTISNIMFRFWLTLTVSRFRSHTRAFFTLTRVKKVRLRAGFLPCSSPFAHPLHSAQNDTLVGNDT